MLPRTTFVSSLWKKLCGELRRSWIVRPVVRNWLDLETCKEFCWSSWYLQNDVESSFCVRKCQIFTSVVKYRQKTTHYELFNNSITFPELALDWFLIISSSKKIKTPFIFMWYHNNLAGKVIDWLINHNFNRHILIISWFGEISFLFHTAKVVHKCIPTLPSWSWLCWSLSLTLDLQSLIKKVHSSSEYYIGAGIGRKYSKILLNLDFSPIV